jgi:hypothetical protein
MRVTGVEPLRRSVTRNLGAGSGARHSELEQMAGSVSV